jgi:hypothetical protein
MENKRKDKRILITVIIFAAILFVGTILYYNSQIANLKNDYNGQIANLKKANLVTALGIHEILNNSTYDANDPTTFNHLDVGGTVTNFGLSTAYNAGLHVVALDITGDVVINMTVPFVAGTYGLGGNRGPLTLEI